MLESKRLFVSDLLLSKLSNTSHRDRNMVDIGVLLANPPKLSQLVQLLRHNSIETLLSFPREQIFDHMFITNFEPLNLFRCCLYERCIQICQEIVRKTINPSVNACIPLMSTTYSEFVQLMDVDLVSLLGLVLLGNPDMRHELHTITISQLSLSLHLITRCQLTLKRPKTSLLQTLKLIDTSLRTVSYRRIFDRPVLQLSRKQLLRGLADGTAQITPSAKSPPYRRSEHFIRQRPHTPQKGTRQPSEQGEYSRMMSILLRRANDITNHMQKHPDNTPWHWYCDSV